MLHNIQQPVTQKKGRHILSFQILHIACQSNLIQVSLSFYVHICESIKHFDCIVFVYILSYAKMLFFFTSIYTLALINNVIAIRLHML